MNIGKHWVFDEIYHNKHLPPSAILAMSGGRKIICLFSWKPVSSLVSYQRRQPSFARLTFSQCAAQQVWSRRLRRRGRDTVLPRFEPSFVLRLRLRDAAR